MARTLVNRATIPVGVIAPWGGGYFTNGSNSGYTPVLGTGASDIIKANDYLADKGWRVCDGAVPNDSESPIYNTASRYLPNLTDSRFLHGFTSIGGLGGSNTLTDHTHGESLTMSHTHTYSDTSDGGTAHYHRIIVGNTSSTTGITPDDGIASTGNYEEGTYYDYVMTGIASTYADRGLSSTESSHTHNISGTSSGASTSTLSGTVGSGVAASSTDNRPKYLNTLYVIKIK